MKNMKNRKGFTLIELMTVVAIIGILVAFVAPHFNKDGSGMQSGQYQQSECEGPNCAKD